MHLFVINRFDSFINDSFQLLLAKKAAGTAGKTKVGKAGPIVEKITFPAEKDTNKLVNYVCGSNIYVEGEDIKVCGD